VTTDWSRYNLPALQAMIAPENECTGADRVLAWEGLATSVRDQRRRLLAAQERLAAIWPPEQNASAQAFQEQISHLADSMNKTLSYAEDTRAGLRGVLEALATAQITIVGLAAGRESVSTDLVPHFIDHAEDEYDEKAQQAMRAAEAAISDHRTQIKAPPPYSLRATTAETFTDPPPGGDGGGGGASTGGPGAGSGPVSLRATPVPVPVPHDPVLGAAPPPGSGLDPGSGSAPGFGSAPGSGTDPAYGVGLGLAGVPITPPAPPPVALPATPAGTSGPVGGPVIGGAGPLGLFPSAGGAGGFPAGGFGAPIGRTGGGPSAGRAAVPIRRGLPSGAVIGGAEHGVGAGGAAGRGATGQMPMGGKAAGRRRGDGSDDPIDGEADQQWVALDGVAPVIAPDTTPVRHDPGPGVLGFGR
jgi:hypothetical protein